MGIFRIEEKDKIEKYFVEDNDSDWLIKKNKWEEFNTSILGLGDIKESSKTISAIAAFFDLEGFTSFCKQIDPHLSTPIFLNHFLAWFFQRIKDETMQLEYEDGIRTWHDLPLLTKFLGDGILVIWDTVDISVIGQGNIIISCKEICDTYTSNFYPSIKNKVSEAPLKLRCGVAKGNIFSVGNGNDFVGPCINFASRLQKLPGVSFAFCDRGFYVSENWNEDQLSTWVVKKIKVRGIGDSELVYIDKIQFDKMSADDKKLYVDP